MSSETVTNKFTPPKYAKTDTFFKRVRKLMALKLNSTLHVKPSYLEKQAISLLIFNKKIFAADSNL
jgi:hypothetical protein